MHARRTQILPERHRPLVFDTKTPHSVATFLVDGCVAGNWRVERRRERATRLVRVVEPDAAAFAVSFGESGSRRRGRSA